jgi:hypothetical protein
VKFEKLDSVQCIDSSNTPLVEGAVYRVRDVTVDRGRELVLADGFTLYYGADRFVKVGSPQPEDAVVNTHEVHLVILRHSMDDFPLRLFKEPHMAKAFAEQQDGEVPEEIQEKLGPLWPEASTPLQVGVLTFKYGSPDRYRLIKEFSLDTET